MRCNGTPAMPEAKVAGSGLRLVAGQEAGGRCHDTEMGVFRQFASTTEDGICNKQLISFSEE